MGQYRVLDMHIRHGVGDKVREYAPGDLMDLTPAEAKIIGKTIVPVAKSQPPSTEEKSKKNGEK